jgi:hypothetical protein
LGAYLETVGISGATEGGVTNRTQWREIVLERIDFKRKTVSEMLAEIATAARKTGLTPSNFSILVFAAEEERDRRDFEAKQIMLRECVRIICSLDGLLPLWTNDRILVFEETQRIIKQPVVVEGVMKDLKTGAPINSCQVKVHCREYFQSLDNSLVVGADGKYLLVCHVPRLRRSVVLPAGQYPVETQDTAWEVEVGAPGYVSELFLFNTSSMSNGTINVDVHLRAK